MKNLKMILIIAAISVISLVTSINYSSKAFASTLQYPIITSVTSESSSTVLIKWKNMNYPTGTTIEIFNSTNGTVNRITGNNTFFEMTGLTKGQTVKFALRAFYDVVDSKGNIISSCYSDFTPTQSIVVGSGIKTSQGGQNYIGTDEQEPNDDKQNANWIRVGNVVYGSSDSSKPDWFKFKAPVSGMAKITIWKDDDCSGVTGGVDAAAEVYDSNSNELAWVDDDFDTDGGTSKTFGVTAGKTYYVRAYGSDLGFYRDGVDYHFKIGYSIGKTTITKVTGKKKSFVAKWNKKAKASFYQVQYIKKSVYTDYGWSRAKKVKVSKNVSSKKITGLKKKKRYYVRVRVARTISGVTYYSGWSPKKAIKTR